MIYNLLNSYQKQHQIKICEALAIADEDVTSLITDTGYCQVLTMITLDNRSDLCQILCDYYTLLKVLPKANQFGKGLDRVGVLTMIQDSCSNISLMVKADQLMKVLCILIKHY